MIVIVALESVVYWCSRPERDEVIHTIIGSLIGLAGAIAVAAILTSAVAMASVFAQAADPISGGAGWVGAGLLGGVLGWLLFVHLPSKDKQLKELMESKDGMVRDLAKEFRLDLDRIVTHCKDENERIVEVFQREMQSVRTEITQPIARVLAQIEKSSR